MISQFAQWVGFSPVEYVATVLGLANVVLIVRRSIWNYPFGLAMVALYGWVFFGARLYSDALLQIFFFVVQIYGWWNWQQSRAEMGEVAVQRLTSRAWHGWLLGCLVATALWGAMMHTLTDAHFPWWDGAIAMLSVAAQILQSRRYLESWLLWIMVDLLAIPLFAVKGLVPTAGLYAIFLAVSVAGFLQWRSAARARATA
jgi:nicotinamide mononucleotide transporter